jgi:hypothetical protein
MLLRVRHGTIVTEGTVPKLKTERPGTSRKKTAKPLSSATKKIASGKAAPSKAAPRQAAKHGAKPSDAAAVSPEDEAAFTKSLIESGEAACLDQEGKLPAGATHKIVEDDAGKTKVVRRRFSMT